MNSKIQQVKEILMKYTDPKPEYTGFSAYEMAKKIVDLFPEPEETRVSKADKAFQPDEDQHEQAMEDMEARAESRRYEAEAQYFSSFTDR